MFHGLPLKNLRDGTREQQRKVDCATLPAMLTPEFVLKDDLTEPCPERGPMYTNISALSDGPDQ